MPKPADPVICEDALKAFCFLSLNLGVLMTAVSVCVRVLLLVGGWSESTVV